MSQLEYSKKNKRELNKFFTEEMTYDYQFEYLDADRRKAFEKQLESDAELKKQLEALKKGFSYAKNLGEIHPNPFVVDQVMQANAWFSILLQKIRYDDWPVGIKLGLETLVIAIFVSIISVFIPWNDLYRLTAGRTTEVILAEISHELEPTAGPETEAPKDSAQVFPDESSGQIPTTTVPIVIPNPTLNVETATAKVDVAAAAPAKVAVPTTLPLPIKADAKVPAKPADAKVTVGALYRGVITVSNVPATTSKLVERLSQLGGRKAGQVELGWKNKEGGTYFHFTLPEARYAEMQSLFGEFGKLKLDKEKHERVMPDGIIRIIINVDETSTPKK